ncbi:MAG: hypothetical protein KAH18_04900 [Psychromonas sp.]|nr:hypothetical protein [Psychromonas sp.]
MGRLRGSIAIEGFNATLRSFPYCRKTVRQGFFRALLCLAQPKKRGGSGHHKGTSAFEILSGGKVDDWLSIIEFPFKMQTH